jgi:hypothetical protein
MRLRHLMRNRRCVRHPNGGSEWRVIGTGSCRIVPDVAIWAHHFVFVEIDGDRIRATAISSRGEVLDEFERIIH